jgi:hypothetical protein
VSLARFSWFHAFAAWLIDRAQRRAPDFIIHGAQPGAYLRRWWIIPRNPILNLYLHQIVRSDDDRALHCHPWCNASLLLRGSYVEVLPRSQAQPGWMDRYPQHLLYAHRSAGELTGRLGHWRHLLEILPHQPECWTLFLTGPVYRRWGFWCTRGWVYWRQYVDARDTGRTAAGCGD